MDLKQLLSLIREGVKAEIVGHTRKAAYYPREDWMASGSIDAETDEIWANIEKQIMENPLLIRFVD